MLKHQLVPNLLALIPCDFLTVWSDYGPAVGSFLHLASEGVCHPRPLVVLRLVVPDLLLVAAVDLGHDELDVLGDQLALLPGHWLTGVGARPHLGVSFSQSGKKPSNLLAIGVSLPKGDTVLLRHIPALRQHLEVLQHALALETHAQVKTVGTL